MGVSNDYPDLLCFLSPGTGSEALGDSGLWAESGLHEVENHLVCFLVSEKVNALREAVGQKVRDVLEEVVMRLRLGIRSLQMPLDDLEDRLKVFEKELKNAERQRISAQDLLAGDRKRTLESLEQQSEALRQASVDHLESVVEASFSAMKDGEANEATVMDALAEEVTSFLQGSAEDVTQGFGRHVTETLRPHQQRADELIQAIRKATAELFNIPYHAPESSEAFDAEQAALVDLVARVAAREADRGDARFEIAAAKVLADNAAREATRAAHQAHGAMGMTQEYPLHLLSRRLWAWRAEYGDAAWTERLGRAAVGAGPEALYRTIAEGSGSGIAV